jgi:O-antigen/teichoic acid export membrane protein
MLVSQTAIYFLANVFSAAFGLLNVVVFTRHFAPSEYGVYVLGAGFAAVASVLLSSWLRLPIMREQARGDGSDVRGHVLIGFALTCTIGPVTYFVGRLVGLAPLAAVTAVCFALSLSYYEVLQELLRARLAAFTMMKATMIRAVLVPSLGLTFAMFGESGVLLLASSTLAYLLAALVFTRNVWRGVTLVFDRSILLKLAINGLPLTLSLTLLAISSVIDRFIVAYFVGPAQAGQYTAGVDLVRQTLIIPAISLAGAFFPLAVQYLANRGIGAVRQHLEECLELLTAITLPASVGLAITSAHVANLVLGPEFRSMATQVMPIVATAVIFQILTQQYLHISFLLSNRNSFYLFNTGSAIAFNVLLACVLTSQFGPVGAAWARLAADVFGFICAVVLSRWAFPVPLAFGRLTYVLLATIVMAITVKGLEIFVDGTDSFSLVILILAGVIVYVLMCLLTNVANARDRLQHGVSALRDIFAS